MKLFETANVYKCEMIQNDYPQTIPTKMGEKFGISKKCVYLKIFAPIQTRINQFEQLKNLTE